MNALLKFAVCLAMLCLCMPAPAADDKATRPRRPKSRPPKRRRRKRKPQPPKNPPSPSSGCTARSPRRRWTRCFRCLAMRAVPSLKDLIARLDKAREDKNVKAVVFTVDGFGIGFAQVEELAAGDRRGPRRGQRGLRPCRQPVDARIRTFAGATRVSLVPTGNLWLMGLYGESPYAARACSTRSA